MSKIAELLTARRKEIEAEIGPLLNELEQINAALSAIEPKAAQGRGSGRQAPRGRAAGKAAGATSGRVSRPAPKSATGSERKSAVKSEPKAAAKSESKTRTRQRMAKPQRRRQSSIAEQSIELLGQNPQGLGTAEIARKLEETHGRKTTNRTVSTQLSSLKRQGRIVQDGKHWKLSSEYAGQSGSEAELNTQGA